MLRRRWRLLLRQGRLSRKWCNLRHLPLGMMRILIRIHLQSNLRELFRVTNWLYACHSAVLDLSLTEPIRCHTL